MLLEVAISFLLAVLILVVFNGPVWAVKLGGFGGLAFAMYLVILFFEWLIGEDQILMTRIHSMNPKKCKCTHSALDHPYSPLLRERGHCISCLCPIFKPVPPKKKGTP